MTYKEKVSYYEYQFGVILAYINSTTPVKSIEHIKTMAETALAFAKKKKVNKTQGRKKDNDNGRTNH